MATTMASRALERLEALERILSDIDDDHPAAPAWFTAVGVLDYNAETDTLERIR